MESKKIIQFGLFTREDDKALVRLGRRWYRVPHWLYVEWQDEEHQRNGIRGIINTWQDGILRRYRRLDCEDEALDNLEREADALRRYYVNPGKSNYYNALDDISRMVLNLDRNLMAERPYYNTVERYIEIAAMLTRRLRSGVTAMMVKQYLLDATRMLEILAERETLSSLRRLQSAIERISYEEMVTISSEEKLIAA